MSDDSQNLIQRIREKFPRLTDGESVTDSDVPFTHRMPVPDGPPRHNYWTDVLAESYHGMADELEDVAENPDGEDVEERLNLIAANVREMAEYYER